MDAGIGLKCLFGELDRIPDLRAQRGQQKEMRSVSLYRWDSQQEHCWDSSHLVLKFVDQQCPFLGQVGLLRAFPVTVQTPRVWIRHLLGFRGLRPFSLAPWGPEWKQEDVQLLDLEVRVHSQSSRNPLSQPWLNRLWRPLLCLEQAGRHRFCLPISPASISRQVVSSPPVHRPVVYSP